MGRRKGRIGRYGCEVLSASNVYTQGGKHAKPRDKKSISKQEESEIGFKRISKIVRK